MFGGKQMTQDLGSGRSSTNENFLPVLSTAGQAFFDHLGITGLRACFEFWRGCRQGDCVPLKARIDPVAMPRHILPNLFIYELIDRRFRCRLAGTEIAAAVDKDPTGRYLDEMASAPAVERRIRLFTGVIERAIPVVYGGQLPRADRNALFFKRLLLPVSTNGASVDIVFGMAIFPSIGPQTIRGRVEDLPYPFEAWATLDEF